MTLFQSVVFDANVQSGIALCCIGNKKIVLTGLASINWKLVDETVYDSARDVDVIP